MLLLGNLGRAVSPPAPAPEPAAPQPEVEPAEGDQTAIVSALESTESADGPGDASMVEQGQTAAASTALSDGSLAAAAFFSLAPSASLRTQTAPADLATVDSLMLAAPPAAAASAAVPRSNRAGAPSIGQIESRPTVSVLEVASINASADGAFAGGLTTPQLDALSLSELLPMPLQRSLN